MFLNGSKESIHFIFGPPELHFIDHCLCQSICWGATVTSEVTVWVLREPVRVWINCHCNLWEGNITPALFCSSSDKTGTGVWVFSRRICSLWTACGISVCSPQGCPSLISWELMTVHPPEEGRGLWNRWPCPSPDGECRRLGLQARCWMYLKGTGDQKQAGIFWEGKSHCL